MTGVSLGLTREERQKLIIHPAGNMVLVLQAIGLCCFICLPRSLELLAQCTGDQSQQPWSTKPSSED